MRRFTKTTKVILFAVFVLCAASCTKQDDNNSFPSGGGSNGGETPEVPASIPQLIREHVEVSASYDDYLITASLTSTLEDVLPDQSIRYGVEYGYLREDEAEDILDNKLYLVRQDNAYSNEFLLFYYADNEWLFGTYGSFNYDIYKYYQQQIQNGQPMTEEDWETYNETLMFLDEYEQKAARAFVGRFFVEVDGVKYDYMYMYFDFWPTLSLDVFDKYYP